MDAAVYEMLAGGTYGINGTRGKQRLAYPNVSPSSRGLALGYIAEAKKYAGPYTLAVTPKVKQTPPGQKIEVTVAVMATSSGAKVPGVKVTLTEAGPDGEHGQVTTGKNGEATWSFTADEKGEASVSATASELPGSQLKVLNPVDTRAQRMLLTGDTTTAKATVSVDVIPASGGVLIRKKDPEGTKLAGATFQLLAQDGDIVAQGKTDAEGVLAFEGLPPGSYRLREIDSGSPAHGTVPDQDITITEGKNSAANPIVVIDPFKPAELQLKKIDKDSHKALPGAVINIAADKVDAGGQHVPGKKVATLTTGADGTAAASLEVLLSAGTRYWATEIKAPAGYELNASAQQFTAKPGALVAITIEDAKTPHPPAPSPPPARPKLTAPAPAAAPQAQLAHTGGGSILWAVTSGAILLAGGSATIWASRRRRGTSDTSAP
ncbi:collagen binding domain-containing protein [Streptomyces sp. NPDC001933]|uniref:MSCRAMM family protein n=1 Tax=Streptomyces sp. NPDC001933 TaxID=3364626 RepID=UPI0036B15BBC